MKSIASFITERNIIKKDHGITFGFIYPAPYNIGMGGMTVITLANLINSLSNWRLDNHW